MHTLTATLCYLFAAGVVLQVFAIGMTFLGGEGQFLEIHRTAGHSVGLVAILACVSSLIGRLPWRLVVAVFVLLLLYVLQYTFIDERNVPLVRALHAVNAVVLFWFSLDLARRVLGYQGRVT